MFVFGRAKRRLCYRPHSFQSDLALLLVFDADLSKVSVNFPHAYNHTSLPPPSPLGAHSPPRPPVWADWIFFFRHSFHFEFSLCSPAFCFHCGRLSDSRPCTTWCTLSDCRRSSRWRRGSSCPARRTQECTFARYVCTRLR